MSVLRVSRPGYETVLIPVDDGAVGRVTHSRLGVKGGSVQGAYVVGVSRTNADKRLSHEKLPPAVRRARHPECGVSIKGGGVCARTPGHAWDHRTRSVMDADAERRRTAGFLTRRSPEDSEERRRAYFREWQRERRAMGLR